MVSPSGFWVRHHQGDAYYVSKCEIHTEVGHTTKGPTAAPKEAYEASLEQCLEVTQTWVPICGLRLCSDAKGRKQMLNFPNCCCPGPWPALHMDCLFLLFIGMTLSLTNGRQ